MPMSSRISHTLPSLKTLGLPASDPDCRFKLQAKSGFGTTSSVRLPRDCIENVHVAIKILAGYATDLNREHKLRELEVLQRLSSVTPDDDYASLLTHSVHPGIDDDKEYFCLVTGLFSSNVQDTLQALQGGFIPCCEADFEAHATTDINPDNIMVDLERYWSTEAINTWVKENTFRTHPSVA